MFGWLKPKYKAEYKVPELTEVRFGGWRYSPKEDINPYEVSLLLPMFLSPFMHIDYQTYVDKNNLRRHFIKIEEEKNASKS
jgi:hypothetical protein